MEEREEKISMALLVDNYCVVIKKESVERIYPEGFFLLIVPAENVYTDDKLLAVRFSSFHNSSRFFKRILKDGLTINDAVLLSERFINTTKPSWLKSSKFLIEGSDALVEIVLSEEEESTDLMIAPVNWEHNRNVKI